MRKLTVLVVDDEELMCMSLRRMIEQYTAAEVKAVCHDGEEALHKIYELSPDLVFLDIRMPGMSGLEVANAIDAMVNGPLVVFVTAHDEFAVRAFAVNALDYILKPFDANDVLRVMRKAQKLLLSKVKEETSSEAGNNPTAQLKFLDKFCVYQGERMEIVAVETILFVFAESKQVFVQTEKGGKYKSRLTLQEFEDKLNPDQFFRCHRNYIVNMDKVIGIEPWFNRGYLLFLKDGGHKIPVSRMHTSNLGKYIQF